MAKHARNLMQLLSWGFVFCSLWTASPSGALEARKNPTNPPVSTGPGTPPQSGGDALSAVNAIATAAKTAIDTDNETVKRVETFYANTVQDFGNHVQIFFYIITGVAALVGLIGALSVGYIARSTAKDLANKVLEKYEAKFSTLELKNNEISSQNASITLQNASITSENEKLHNGLTNFQKEARANLHGLRSAFLAWAQLMNYMLKIGEAEGQQKLKLEGQRQEAKRQLLQLYNEIKPTDELVLSLANSVNGLILFLRATTPALSMRSERQLDKTQQTTRLSSTRLVAHASWPTRLK